MAKGKKRLFSNAPATILYWSVNDMPWESIETGAGHSFSSAEKEEILDCTRTYSFHISQANAPTLLEVSDLVESLRAHAEAIVEIADRYWPEKPKVAVFEDETIAFGASGLYDDRFSLRLSTQAAARASKELLDGLQNGIIEDIPLFSSDPKATALAGFVADVFDGAISTPARNKLVGARERVRWGIAVGPQSTVFQRFLNAVLQQNFTINQIKEAVRRGRPDYDAYVE